jgi:hypothetical protein
MKNINQTNGHERNINPQGAAAPTPAALDNQLELGLSGAPGCQSPAARRRRLNRANWWFERMRQLVDRACDWQPAPEPRPEQIWFPNAHRQSATSPQLNPAFGQICE